MSTKPAYKYRVLLAVAMLAVAAPIAAFAEPVVLIDNGQVRAAIFVAPEVMAAQPADRTASRIEQDRQADRIKLRDSVNDLAHYLEQITGAKVAINAGPPDADDKVTPILIGDLADPGFGKFDKTTTFGQAFRVVVSSKGVGLQGETDEATSYAIYQVLDDLGCRWFIPGDLGECIPSRKTIALEPGDRTLEPGTVTRNIWYADAAFKRRNRLGGFHYTAGHALEGYVTKEQLEANIEWCAEIKGERKLHKCDVGYRVCWANDEVAAAIADSLIQRLDKNPVECISISPGDGINFCECDKCKALDTGDWDPTVAGVSITDRYVNFCNKIAARVAKKHPDTKLGFLAYVNFARPPLREKLHPSLIPQLAPITYCRAHTLDDPNCESRQQLRMLLEGWGKVSKNVAMYEYYFHLAEVAAPFPAIRRNVVELPVQFANNVTMWTPETMPNFESFMPGLYLGMRMAWYTDADPNAILDEYYSMFFGSAGDAMRAYQQHIDDCWTTVPDHTGCGFSYVNRFTPERMAKARTLMDAAIKACKTDSETRRVALADASFRQHELFMKVRWDYFAGRYEDLAADADKYAATHEALANKYAANSAFSQTRWAKNTIAVRYFNAFFARSYRDMHRIGTEAQIITKPKIEWSYAVDKEDQGESLGWHKADFDDSSWKTTDVSTENWSGLGLEQYYGAVWYRAVLNVPSVPEGKKAYVWVGATDGSCKVYVNGKHVPFINTKGESLDEATGYCMPFSFDATDAILPNADNQITIVGTRNFLNELGTGGLMGPVLVYCEK